MWNMTGWFLKLSFSINNLKKLRFGFISDFGDGSVTNIDPIEFLEIILNIGITHTQGEE
jgi:hypothetical protein